ncbi:alpha-galactosidase [Anaerocolumna sp. MB42-C2]|uniref:alpha-galactosidase n=1 Tax=Anaerocolumna sp. MB42-C2 TaxID=3070997 RepID=UPI0027DF2480|nr:alpha-galactosidase [Anaerocolumna sp. MB42-C2]WMJ89739.1 alpha-galactosidase [Anaerocolumna sp. MB42-C2]
MPIQVYENKTFLLNTEKTSYVFKIDKNGILNHLYWGRKIDEIKDFEDSEIHRENSYHACIDKTMEECSSFGMMRYKETSIKLRYSDGVGDFRYQVTGYEVNNNCLLVTLKDIFYPFQVTLFYEVFEKENIIKRYRKAENLGESDIVLERFYSAEYGIPGTSYELINFNGTWGAEFKRYSDKINAGKKVYESLRGSTAHVANPCFMIHKDAEEDRGEVYYGALEYSGNFKIVAEATPYEYLNVLIGVSDTDFSWVLKSGDCFETPAVYCGYSGSGFAEMSHTMHRFCLEELAPKAFAEKPLRVLYNSWYATLFDVRFEEQVKLAKKAAGIGAELFVIDDGWFGNRNSDFSSLGDWYVSKVKFPEGLNPLIEEVNKLNMGFGIWIEPEMVNEDSNLYREHPDWVYQYPNRTILKGRNQYALNLTKEEVVQFMIQFIDVLLTEYKIDYIKWDMNRPVGETSVCGETPEERKEVWVKHTRNFYRVINECRKRHPEVEFEACASGGGRVDLGAMRYFDEYWPSDNVDALDRLEIQESYSYIYPAKYMRAWITDTPDGLTNRKIPVTFAMRSAMCGSLGIGNNLNTISNQEAEEIKKQVAVYKKIRNIVQFGKLYRLKSLTKDEFHAVQYQKDGSGIVFSFLINGRYGKEHYNLKFKGLCNESNYRISANETVYEKSGAYLMYHGLDIVLKGDYDSQMIEIIKDR